MPRVSVLLPVHDAEATLDEALACVLAQTLTDFELIIVLNGIRDGSGDITRRWAQTDPRVRVLELPEAGLVPALNAGLEVARADLIARHDADDLMDPRRLALQAQALDANPSWSLATCAVRCTGIGDAPAGPGMKRHVEWLNSLQGPEHIANARFIDAPVAHPAVMLRASVLRDAGGYLAGDFPEDHDLWLRLLEQGHRFGMIPETLVSWRDRPDRLTRTDPRLRDAARRHLVHRHLLEGPLSRGRHCRIWGAGPYGRRHARDLQIVGVPVDDLIDIDPKKIGRVVAGSCPVVAAESLGGPDGRLLLLAVAAQGARKKIATFLAARGYTEAVDFYSLH